MQSNGPTTWHPPNRQGRVPNYTSPGGGNRFQYGQQPSRSFNHRTQLMGVIQPGQAGQAGGFPGPGLDQATQAAYLSNFNQVPPNRAGRPTNQFNQQMQFPQVQPDQMVGSTNNQLRRQFRPAPLFNNFF